MHDTFCFSEPLLVPSPDHSTLLTPPSSPLTFFALLFSTEFCARCAPAQVVLTWRSQFQLNGIPLQTSLCQRQFSQSINSPRSRLPMPLPSPWPVVAITAIDDSSSAPLPSPPRLSHTPPLPPQRLLTAASKPFSEPSQRARGCSHCSAATSPLSRLPVTFTTNCCTTHATQSAACQLRRSTSVRVPTKAQSSKPSPVAFVTDPSCRCNGAARYMELSSKRNDDNKEY